MEHVRQSRPDSGLGFPAKVLKNFQIFLSSLGSCKIFGAEIPGLQMAGFGFRFHVSGDGLGFRSAFRHLGFRFRDSGFVFRISGFVSGSDFRVSGIGFRGSGFRFGFPVAYLSSGVGFRIKGFVSGLGFRDSVSGFRFRVVYTAGAGVRFECRGPVSRFRVRGAGLGFGFWIEGFEWD